MFLRLAGKEVANACQKMSEGTTDDADVNEGIKEKKVGKEEQEEKVVSL